MKYPKLKPEQRRNQKLSPARIKQIKSMFDNGMSVWKISKQLNHKYETIRRYVDPDFKQKLNDYYAKYNLQKYHKDPNFKKQVNETRRRNLKLQRQTYPTLDEYNRQKSKLQRERQWANLT